MTADAAAPSLPPLPYGKPRDPRDNLTHKGRPKGVPNKVNQTLKLAILLAAEEVGDKWRDAAAEKGEVVTGGLTGYLAMVASSDIKAFCALLGRVLPLEVTGKDGEPLEVVFRTVYEGGPGDDAKLIEQ